MSPYIVQLDDENQEFVEASSLAEVANKVRGKAKRVRIWSPCGLQLIDTKFGDQYNLVKED